MKLSFAISSLLFLFSCRSAPTNSSSDVSCTGACVSSGNDIFLAKSYDWLPLNGRVYLNKAGVIKSAVLKSKILAQTTGGLSSKPNNALAWQSTYASLTFTQYIRDFPVSGINNRGLVIEVLVHATAGLPKDPTAAQIAINELQWVQHQLDTAERVDQVIASTKTLFIEKLVSNLHYLVCDRFGDCAVIEHVDGKTVVTEGKALQRFLITNHSLDESRKYLEEYEKSQKEQPVVNNRTYDNGTQSSLDRFVIASNILEKQESYDPEFFFRDYFPNIAYQSKASSTIWNIVYDIKKFKVYFRTMDNPYLIRTIDLHDVKDKFHCKEGDIYTADMLDKAGIPAMEDKKFTYFDMKDQLKRFDLATEQKEFWKSLEPVNINYLLKTFLFEQLKNYSESHHCVQ